MRNFFDSIKPKLWLALIALVGSWIPWIINLFVKEAFKQTVKGFAERNDVSSGVYQLLAISATHPISATLTLLVLIVGGAAIYSAVEARRNQQKKSDDAPLTGEDKIKITLPRNGEALSDKQPKGESFSYVVRGTLKSLPEPCKIWLLVSGLNNNYWPQTFCPVHYDEATGDWEGRVDIGGTGARRIIALVAPLTSQQLFQYFKKVGDLRRLKKEQPPFYEPLDAIPAECGNTASVNTWTP